VLQNQKTDKLSLATRNEKYFTFIFSQIYSAESAINVYVQQVLARE
jgi:hypothetical protein